MPGPVAQVFRSAFPEPSESPSAGMPDLHRGCRNQRAWRNRSTGKHGGTGKRCSEPGHSLWAPKAPHVPITFSSPRSRSTTQPSSSTSMTGGQSITGGTLPQGCWCSSLPCMCVMRWVAQSGGKIVGSVEQRESGPSQDIAQPQEEYVSVGRNPVPLSPSFSRPYRFAFPRLTTFTICQI